MTEKNVEEISNSRYKNVDNTEVSELQERLRSCKSKKTRGSDE